MFNPAFIDLFIQEVDNENQIITAIWEGGINVFFIGPILAISAYKIFSFVGIILRYILTALWNLLTPGQQWVEITLIVCSIISAVMLIVVFEGMSNIIDNNFEKIKAEIIKKDERIRELEAKLMEGEKNEGEKNEEELEAKKLEEWFS